MKNILAFAALLLAAATYAQPAAPSGTPSAERMKGFDNRNTLRANSLVANVPFRSAGPTIMSGRVVDVDANPADPTIFYVAYASGGLWKTENNGTSFKPLFDDQSVMTIGDIAVDWKNNIIWVGTGENNSSRSSYAGNGMYKSTDGGKTWQYLGLPESHHIGRIVLHPTNPDIAWVAVLGHLYSPNKDRGVYKTTDGGKKWTQVLAVNDLTGAVDLIADPANPDILFAATWQRIRHAWDFSGAGNGSAIWKSTDAGEHWNITSGPKNYFPNSKDVGRIGLTATRKNGKTILYAVLDNQAERPKKDKKDEKGLTKNDLRNISKDDFLKLDKTKLSEFLRKNGFPRKYSADKVIGMVKNDEIKPTALVEYLEDANANLFDTEVIGAEVYRSEDLGQSWRRTHANYLDDLFFTYGYYFGQIRAETDNPDRIFILGVPILRSDDAGKTFKSAGGDNVHGDHHALWLNPQRKGHLINGNDGGVNISYDNGEHWIKCNTPAVGQFYAVAYDLADPYNVYGGLQDNGVWTGPGTYKAGTDWHDNGKYPYEFLLGGDGMQVQVDTRDNNTVYAGFQFGNYFRINKTTGERTGISPKHDLGERPLRFNWQTPIQLSSFNQDILYLGAHKLYRSLNRGNDWEPISGDLTQGGVKGNIPYGTISTLHESPKKFGLLYVGTDDGLVQLTKDGGNTWTDITGNLPRNYWVSRVQASSHDKGRVYVALNGYRWDDFNAYLYKSDNYGQTWERIGTDLPAEPVNVVREDPNNPDLLYVGTDHGIYVSLNRGKTFMRFDKNMPAVAVHDLVIHPKAGDLVAGTHGRSIYIATVKHLQQLTEKVLRDTLYAFDIDPVSFSPGWGQRWSTWAEPNEPTKSIPVYAAAKGTVYVSVKTDKGLLLRSFKAAVSPGINYPEYDLTIEESAVAAFEQWLNEKQKDKKQPVKLEKAKNGKYYLQKGTYSVELEKDGRKWTKELVIE